MAQKEYIDAIRNYDIVFGIGPAGTGKTYLAMAMAVAELMKNNFTRMVLTRPAVEAGEKLGFLPGDLAEKVNPYLRPLYDALHDMVDFDRAQKMLERGVIEVAPLAFMRGRTLNDSFVILDEAQNTTGEQMKMFLTRLGYGSKAVITGDVTQIDLPTGKASGLKEARVILAGIEGIRFCGFTERDVVRHRLVQDVIARLRPLRDRARAAPRHQRRRRRVGLGVSGSVHAAGPFSASRLQISMGRCRPGAAGSVLTVVGFFSRMGEGQDEGDEINGEADQVGALADRLWRDRSPSP